MSSRTREYLSAVTAAGNHRWAYVRKVVAAQSADDDLWLDAATPLEADLQRELFRLHDAIERASSRA